MAARPQPKAQAAPRRVTVLGATGSIGRSTIDLLKFHHERFQVAALTGHRNVDLLAAQARELHAETAVIGDENLYSDLKSTLSGSGIKVAAGRQAVIEAAMEPADWTMSAIVGMAGMAPTMAAIGQGKTVAIANKESIVAAGPFVMAVVEKSGATLLPVDSEHNAVFQVFRPEGVARVILTASGGPFLRRSRTELAGITPEQAVKHPNWAMGAKVSVDSATMMNKSLEIIEAAYLFNLKIEHVEALIHPQSLVHSLVEYVDGSILSQMGAPDMRTPIAHTLGWPERIETTGSKLDLNKKFNIEFEPIDNSRFPAVEMAKAAFRQGAGYPTVMNAANEIAVGAFLENKLPFAQIESISDAVLQSVQIGVISGIDDVIGLDATARRLAADKVKALQ